MVDKDHDPIGAAPTLSGSKTKGGSDGDRPRRPRLSRPGRFSRFAILLGIAVVILAILVGPILVSAFKKTPRDRYGISYGGGIFEGPHYQRIVKPGHSLFFNGFMDNLYLYPSDQRNYIISKTPTVGSTKGKDSIMAPSADRVQVEYQVATYF